MLQLGKEAEHKVQLDPPFCLKYPAKQKSHVLFNVLQATQLGM